MIDPRYHSDSPGPFTVDQVRPGDRYELSEGHAIYCAPTGGEGSKRSLVGAEVLATDPMVESAGLDTGFALDGKRTMRAPDIAIGGVSDEAGWVKGFPTLAVEYAGVGQDEPDLQRKIIELLNAGTKFVWVVRLVGERRVEVYEKGLAPVTFHSGSDLRADGILQNVVPVDALFDQSYAHELTLRNLLQRKGFEDLEAVRREGKAEGKAEGQAETLREVIVDLCEAYGIALDADRSQLLAAMPLGELTALRQRIKRERRW